METPQTCQNFIPQGSNDHTSYWLDYVFPVIKKNQPEQAGRTFERGYTCKLIFGLEITLLFFVLLSFLTAAWKPLVDLAMRREVTVIVTPLQIIFVLLCLVVAGLLRILNSPASDMPTGCWHAWREINDAHKLWMRNNDHLLVDVICHANGNGKSFAPKT